MHRAPLVALCCAVFLLAQTTPAEAERLYAERRFREAAFVLQRHLAESPADRNSLLLLALSWQQAGELGKSAAAFIDTIKRYPRWSNAHLGYARVLFLQGQFEPAIRHARLAAEYGEPPARVQLLIGRIEEERSRLEPALIAYRAAIEAARNLAEPLAAEAAVLYKLGRYNEAASSVRAALRIEPKNKDALRLQNQLSAPSPTQPPSTPLIPVRLERIEPIEFILNHSPTPAKHLVSTMAGGVAIFDYDNDGLPDIFFANGAAVPSLQKSEPRFFNRLYRNLGNWQFQDVTEHAGLQGEGFSVGANAADFDNDGWTDLFVAGAGRNLLYRNNRGRFELLRNAISDEKWSVGSAWLDYDRDGRLDLFVVNYLDWSPERDLYCGDRARNLRIYCHPREFKGTANRLYRNLGSGKFEDVSGSSGIARHTGKGMSAAVADYDGDGFPDLFVTNDTEPNFLFHNLGNGRFEELGMQSGAALSDQGKPVSAMGAEFRDFDNDGRPDILFTALPGETFPLLRNLDGKQFRDVTYPSRSGLATARRAGWGIALADFNNDGWKDILTANAHVTDNIEQINSERYKEPNLLLLNSGGTFSHAVDLGEPKAHRGLAVADLNNDGLLDAVVTVLGEKPEVWKNVSPGAGHWLKIRLTGQAIGARIRAGKQWQEVTAGAGYASSSTGPVHFGLGAAESVDIEIVWPSGARTLRTAKVDQVLTISPD